MIHLYTLKAKIIPVLLFVYFLSWIWYRGVPLGDSFRLSLVVGIQIASGSLIWRRICWRLDPSALENFGMGLAVGTAVSTIFDQLFLNTFLQPIAWLLPLIFVAWIRHSSARIWIINWWICNRVSDFTRKDSCISSDYVCYDTNRWLFSFDCSAASS